MIVGFTGPARAGKSTAAEFLARRGFVAYAFAQPLKEALSVMLRIRMEELELPSKDEPLEPYGKSLRHMMQTLGTEWGRQMIHPDLWVMLADQKLKGLRAARGGHFPPNVRLSISDVRFNNEAYWLRSVGGKLIHIRRQKGPFIESRHASEGGVMFDAQRDLVLENNGTPRQLEIALCTALDIPLACEEIPLNGFKAAEDILTRVSEQHGIPRDTLVGRGRTSSVIAAKREAIGLMCTNTRLTLVEIARLVGLQDHTTVIHHLKVLGFRQ